MTVHEAHSVAAMLPEGAPGYERESLRPKNFAVISLATVAAIHLACLAYGVHSVPEEFGASDTLDAELVNEGDFFDAQAIDEAEENNKELTKAEEKKQREAAVAPPEIKNPEADSLPAQKKDEKTDDKKNEKKADENRPLSQAREAQAARRAGAPHGRGSGGGATQARCLSYVAKSLRQRLPATTRLGKGWANVSFNIDPGGGVSGIAVSASTPGHAALAHRVISGVRGAPSCGAEFVSQRITFD